MAYHQFLKEPGNIYEIREIIIVNNERREIPIELYYRSIIEDNIRFRLDIYYVDYLPSILYGYISDL